MDRSTTKCSFSDRVLFFILPTIIIIISGCGNGDGHNSLLSDSNRGSISFMLDFKKVPSAQIDQMSLYVNICDSYGIDTITASVRYTDGTVVASGSWPCSDHTAQLDNIPSESGLILTVEALVSGLTLWRGQINDIKIIPSQNTDIGEVTMAYISGPTADAGPDQTVTEGATVTLSGLNSYDLDDGIASFQWFQVEGVKVSIDTPNEPVIVFSAPDVDTSGAALIFSLRVTDYMGEESYDSCIVNVTWVNDPPLAHAGEDQTVHAGTKVWLDATSSVDLDDGIASYQWIQENGPVVDLLDANTAKPHFKAPDVDQQGVSLTFLLTVADVGGLKDTDTCAVNVSWVNSPPVANAGKGQEVISGETVILDGSESWDEEDQQNISFSWHQTETDNTIPVELIPSSGAAQPEFIAPIVNDAVAVLEFELTVMDSGGLRGIDTCQITILPDHVAPTVAITNPQFDISDYREKDITFTGTASDNIDVNKTIRVIWQNSATNVSGDAEVAINNRITEWKIEKISLKRGSNLITVTAIDSSGNQGNASRIIIKK